MIRNDGGQFIKYSNDAGLCYWALDNWSDKTRRKEIENTLKDYDEIEYLNFLKQKQD